MSDTTDTALAVGSILGILSCCLMGLWVSWKRTASRGTMKSSPSMENLADDEPTNNNV
jgi:hypothetical protein